MRKLPQYLQLPQHPHPTWPDAIIGAQSGNAATNMLDDLGKRVEAGEAGALAAPIPSESLEMLNNLNGRVEERGGQAGE